MRPRASIIAAVAVAGLVVGPAVQSAVLSADAALSTNLVLLYRFNTHTGTTVVDATTYRQNGTLVNVSNPDSAYVAGLSGYQTALNLVASQRQYVNIPDSSVLHLNRFTLAALVRYTGTQTADTLDRWEVMEKDGSYWLNIRTNGHVRAGGFFGGCASRNWKYLDSAAVVPTNTWTHVAATYNGSRLTIYVNGAASGSMSVSGTLCVNDQPLAVGAKNAPAKGILEAFWDGQLDDVRVYNKALTATAIANLAP